MKSGKKLRETERKTLKNDRCVYKRVPKIVPLQLGSS